ncbi:MAG: hypothetical protein HYT07_00680 [Candidatus Levybacteria bacterium]|nr:hypothetical protein [Candidatus Levybacteria bacterium]
MLPVRFLKFWYLEAPRGLIAYFVSLNSAFLHLFSLPLLVKTYFRPWKNEYREGLVGFSVGMGIFIKTFVIAVDILLFFLLLLAQALVFAGFILWPIVTVAFLFQG